MESLLQPVWVDAWYVVLHSNRNDRLKIDEAKELIRANAQGHFVFWEWLGSFHSNLKVSFLNICLSSLPQDEWEFVRVPIRS